MSGIGPDAILTILGVLAASGLGIRELITQRRTLRQERESPPAEPFATLNNLPLTVKDVRISTMEAAGSAQRLTFSLEFTGSPPIGSADADERFPEEVTVVDVSGQPFDLPKPGQRRGRQTSGDDDAGFYRITDTAGWPPGARIETYRWGRLTAGVAVRVLWLLLLPFQLANVALWLCPEEGRFRRAAAQYLCRLLALTLSASVVLAFAGAALDLSAWQCTYDFCNTVGEVPQWLAGTDHIGRRLAITALVPIAAIVLVWALARQTWGAYEAYAEADGRTEGRGLSSPAFWRGKETVRRLRAIHVATIFSTLALVVLAALEPVGPAPWRTVLLTLGVAIIAVCALALALPRIVQEDTEAEWPDRLVATLLLFAVGLTAGTLWYAWEHRTQTRVLSLPYYQATVTWVFVGELVLVGLMVLVVTTQRRDGWGAARVGVPVFAGLAIGAAAGLEAGLIYRTADVLTNINGLGPTPVLPYQWAGLGFAIMILLAGVSVFATVVPDRRQKRAARALTDQRFPRMRRLGPHRAELIDRAIASSGILHRVVRVLSLAPIPILALGLAGAVLTITNTRPPTIVVVSWLPLGISSVRYALGGALLFGLLTFVLIARRRPRVLHVLGFLWQLGTFWPRTCHPLGPPCYAARTVPELAARVDRLAEATPHSGVVLVGQGQGSILAIAAVLQLPDTTRGRVALMTVGSPAGSLYPRVFPEHFHKVLLQELTTALTAPRGIDLPRWINLWRITDPLSGEIHHAPQGVNRELNDPIEFEIIEAEGNYRPILGHAKYPADPEFSRAIRYLADSLRQPRD